VLWVVVLFLRVWCGWVRAGTGFLMRRGYAKIVTLCPPSPTHTRPWAARPVPSRTSALVAARKAATQRMYSRPARLTTTTSVWKGPAAGDDFGVPPPHEEPAAGPFQTPPAYPPFLKAHRPLTRFTIATHAHLCPCPVFGWPRLHHLLGPCFEPSTTVSKPWRLTTASATRSNWTPA
jgi:hypothetical protein